DGSISAFVKSPNFMAVSTRSMGYTTVNGYIYALGGSDGGVNVLYTTVQFASLPRVSIASNLDLLGLTSFNMSSASGDFSNGVSGGSLFAANIFGAGGLQINRASQFW